MNLIVLDANVILKWFFIEHYRTDAMRYLTIKNISLIIPDFALYECAGAIRRKIARKEVTSLQGEIGFNMLMESESLQLIPSRQYLNRAFYLSNLINHELYDCIYLTMAERFNTVVVTADKKFYSNVLHNTAFRNFVHWIEDPIEC